jgi:L-aminopeptidase/D-esterase-like protein
MKCIVWLAALSIVSVVPAVADERPRARDLGIAPGILSPGDLNAITDVDGVRVGHVTVRDGTPINTGVTVIIPATGNLYRHKLPAAIYVANGSGDYVIAFSTDNSVRRDGNASTREIGELANGAMSPLFQAVAEATEEAIYNSLLQAEDVAGHRGAIKALPIDAVKKLLDPL